MGTAERRIEIMKYLCRKRYATMPELARAYGVSVRTIQRDVFELAFLMPIVTKSGKYDGGVYVLGDYTMDRMYMTDAEIKLLMKVKLITACELSGSEKMLMEHMIHTYQKPSVN